MGKTISTLVFAGLLIGTVGASFAQSAKSGYHIIDPAKSGFSLVMTAQNWTVDARGSIQNGSTIGTLKIDDQHGHVYPVRLRSDEVTGGKIHSSLFGDILITGNSLGYVEYRMTASQIRKIQKFLHSKANSTKQPQSLASSGKQHHNTTAQQSVYRVLEPQKAGFTISIEIGSFYMNSNLQASDLKIAVASIDDLRGHQYPIELVTPELANNKVRTKQFGDILATGTSFRNNVPFKFEYRLQAAQIEKIRAFIREKLKDAAATPTLPEQYRPLGDPSLLQMTISVQKLSQNIDGDNVLLEGTVSSISVGGKELELQTNDIVQDGEGSWVVTKLYGRIRVAGRGQHAPSPGDLSFGAWVMPSQEAKLKKLRGSKN